MLYGNLLIKIICTCEMKNNFDWKLPLNKMPAMYQESCS